MRWSKNHKIVIPSNPEISFTEEYEEIKQSISTFFTENGYQTKIIYRTVSNDFDLNESPDNLLPTKINENRIRVYIDFNSYKRHSKNIRFIIAFPENTETEIPRQEKAAWNSGKPELQKIDLNKVIQTKHRCYFESIE